MFRNILRMTVDTDVINMHWDAILIRVNLYLLKNPGDDDDQLVLPSPNDYLIEIRSYTNGQWSEPKWKWWSFHL